MRIPWGISLVVGAVLALFATIFILTWFSPLSASADSSFVLKTLHHSGDVAINRDGGDGGGGDGGGDGGGGDGAGAGGGDGAGAGAGGDGAGAGDGGCCGDSGDGGGGGGGSPPPPPPPPPPTCTIYPSISAIQSGQSTTLNYIATNATTGTLNNGIGAVVIPGSSVVSPTQTTTYILTVTGAGGNAQCQTSVTVNTPPPPSCTIYPSISAIQSGQSTTLNYSATNATTGTLNNGIGAVVIPGSIVVSPTQTTTYILTVTGAGGNAQCQTSVTVNNPPPSCTIYPSISAIQKGSNTTLIYSATNATTGTINNGVGVVSIPGQTVVSPQQTTTYTLTVTGAGGNAQCQTTVTVTYTPPTPPSCTLNAEPDHIIINADPILSWTSQGATSASLNAGIGSVALNGSISVFPQETTTYILTVTGPGGTAQCQKTVTVTVEYVQPATCEIHANPTTVSSGGQTTLTWSSTDSTDQWISNIGNVSPNGSMSVSVYETTTYVFHVSGMGGNGQCQTTVTVGNNPPPPPPPSAPYCSITASPYSIQSGQSSVLSWTSENASSATLSDNSSVAVNGSKSVSPTQTTTYTLTVTGTGGTAQCSKTVTVNTPPPPPPPSEGHPTCELTGVPPQIASGQSATISWTSQNATSVTFSGAQGGQVPLSGSFIVMPLQTTTYEIIASNDSGEQKVCTATVVVTQPEQKVVKCYLPSDMMPGANEGTLVGYIQGAFATFGNFLSNLGIQNSWATTSVQILSQ